MQPKNANVRTKFLSNNNDLGRKNPQQEQKVTKDTLVPRTHKEHSNNNDLAKSQ